MIHQPGFDNSSLIDVAISFHHLITITIIFIKGPLKHMPQTSLYSHLHVPGASVGGDLRPKPCVWGERDEKVTFPSGSLV